MIPETKSEPEQFGIYSDVSCTDAKHEVYWGKIAPGATKSVELFVKNKHTLKLTALNCAMTNVQPPEAEAFFTLSGSTATDLAEGSVAATTLSLTVDPKIEKVNVFSFDVVLTASFSESVASSDEGALDEGALESSNGHTGGGGTRVIEEESTTIESDDGSLLTSAQQIILMAVVGLVLYFILGKNH